MDDWEESRDEAAEGLSQGLIALALGFVMFFFAEPTPEGGKDWLWLSFSGLVTLFGIVVTVRNWRRLWSFRRWR